MGALWDRVVANVGEPDGRAVVRFMANLLIPVS
jgi:hypothetical protein